MAASKLNLNVMALDLGVDVGDHLIVTNTWFVFFATKKDHECPANWLTLSHEGIEVDKAMLFPQDRPGARAP